MSQSTITPFGDHAVIDLMISRQGKLGIEFRQTSAPYFVVKVSDEAKELYAVLPGDLLIGIRRSETDPWTDTENLAWLGLVDILKNRPAFARFKRFGLPPTPSPKNAIPEVSPVNETPENIPLSPPRALQADTHMVPIEHLPEPVRPTPIEVVPQPPLVPSPSSPREGITIIYSTDGPLGLEFEETDYPFRVSAVAVGSMSHEKGVHRGDLLVSVNGKSTESMGWMNLREELGRRPSEAVFDRPAQQSNVTPSGGTVWGLAAGLLKHQTNDSPEVDELRRLVATYNAEDIESLKQRSLKLDSVSAQLLELQGELEQLKKSTSAIQIELQDERAKNNNLVEVISEMESSHSSVIFRFETDIADRDKQISTLSSQLSELSSRSHSPAPPDAQIELLNSTIAAQDSKIELIEKDNTRLRKENTDLGLMVQQCLEKIQKDLADKPHWVDRRVVCAAIGTLLREVSDPAASPEAHAVARQRLGDVLGLTQEERTAMGLLSVPATASVKPQSGLGENFVSFLQHEIDPESEVSET
jgi:hypothetical protein